MNAKYFVPAFAVVVSAIAASAAPLRMLSFNIWGDFFKNPVQEREAGVEAAFVKIAPDVAAFQETTRSWWNSPMFANLKKAGYGIVRCDEKAALRRAGATDEKTLRRVNYFPLLYLKKRLRLLDSGLEFFHLRLGGPKGFTWAVFEDVTDGRRFIAFATHFWWQSNGAESDAVREYNALHLVWKAADLRKQWGDIPAICGGDLNSPPGSLPHEVFKRNGWLNAADVADVRSPHRSHHGNPERGADGKYHGAVRPAEEDLPALSIDHVLFTEGIHALRQDIVIDQFVLDVSDHSPVVVDFEITGDSAKRSGK